MIQIWTQWVMQPPYFNTITRAPSTGSFTLSMIQHTAPGTVISASPLLGYTKDPWQVSSLGYSWLPSASSALFTVNPTTAVVSLALSEWIICGVGYE